MSGMVSAIIPVYNTPKDFLEECITSLLHQTYSNFEIIIVDDGSKDETAALCNEIAQRDSRIQVIHQKNQGPSLARNTGLNHVHGDFVTFVDSDDTLSPDAWKSCVQALNDYHADCAVFGWIDNSQEVPRDMVVSQSKTTSLSSDEAMIQIASDNDACGGGYPWNKFWRVSPILQGNNDKFPLFDKELFTYEDKEWILRVLQSIRTVILLPNVFYDYRYVPGSLTNAAESWYRRQYNAYVAYDKILAMLKDKNYKAYRGAVNFYFYFCFMDLYTQYQHPDWFGGKERCRKTKKSLYHLCKNVRFRDLNGYKRKIIWLIMQIWGIF